MNNNKKSPERRKNLKKSPQNNKNALPGEIYKIKYTYKEGTKQRENSGKFSYKQTRRLYSPVEAEKKNRIENRVLRHPRRTPVITQASEHEETNQTVKKLYEVASALREHILHLDYITIATVALLSIIGILFVHSATLTKGSSRFDTMQIAMTVVGFCIMFALSYIDYDTLTKNYRFILIFNIAMLAFTAIFGTGADGGGGTNHNWIRIGPVGIQPAEIGKILYIITFSAHLDAVKHRINNIKTILGLLMHSGLIIGLVLLEKDLGQATVYIAITIVMCFAARMSLWYFAGAGTAILAAAPVIWTHLKDYQKQRILVGFNPELDPLDKGYQVIQSKTAIASGGITGLGYRRGLISQTELLPAKWTDMIFAVISEEWGLFGSLFVIGLFLVLVLRIFYNSLSADKMSGTLICAGVAGMLMYQIVENIGMCLGLLPVVGITLPFLSYGGSSVLGVYIAIGMVISVYAKKDKYYFKKGRI